MAKNSYSITCPCCNSEFDFYTKKEVDRKEREIRKGIKWIIKSESKKKKVKSHDSK